MSDYCTKCSLCHGMTPYIVIGMRYSGFGSGDFDFAISVAKAVELSDSERDRLRKLIVSIAGACSLSDRFANDDPIPAPQSCIKACWACDTEMLWEQMFCPNCGYGMDLSGKEEEDE